MYFGTNEKVMRQKAARIAPLFPFLIESFCSQETINKYRSTPFYEQGNIFDLQGNIEPSNQNSKDCPPKSRTKTESSWLLDVIEAQNSSSKMSDLPVVKNNLSEEIRKKILCLKA